MAKRRRAEVVVDEVKPTRTLDTYEDEWAIPDFVVFGTRKRLMRQGYVTIQMIIDTLRPLAAETELLGVVGRHNGRIWQTDTGLVVETTDANGAAAIRAVAIRNGCDVTLRIPLHSFIA